MRQIINNLLEEKFEQDQSVLTFSEERIEMSLVKGEVREGFFDISISDYRYEPEGYVMANGDGMECMTQEFKGPQIRVPYRFHSKGMEEGDVVQGEFAIISNKGEYYLPYVVSIEHKVLHSSLGPVKNLFHFTNLAKTDWKEAVELFYSTHFIQIFNAGDKEQLPAYKLMSSNFMNEQNVEEFLYVINKKQPIEYTVSENKVELHNPFKAHQDMKRIPYELEITKNGWGYVHLELETSDELLVLEKNVLTETDFSGNSCRITVFIEKEKVHQGRNIAVLKVNSPYESVETEFVVQISARERTGSNDQLEMKRTITQLMTYYVAFRLRKISTDTWISESMPLLDKMNARDDKNIASRLFQAHLLIAEEKYHEAKWILDYAEQVFAERECSSAERCYFLYLTTLYNREEEYVNQITDEVEGVFMKDQTNWRIAWILLFLRMDLQESGAKRWLFMEEQYERNCFSPVMYVEAIQQLHVTPSLLMKTEAFEEDVLLFAMKQEVLTEDMMSQLNAVIAKNKIYSEKLFQVCVSWYNKTCDVDTLTSICTMLVKGQIYGEKYLKWYRLGIENELRITRLYEHYMLSVNLNKPEAIPKMVLMYFAYQSDLDDLRNAYLYSYVVRYRNQSPEMFEAYHVAIERFLVDQISKGRIDRNLAYLYHQMMTPGMLSAERALEFIPILFTNLLEVQDASMERVILIHEKTAGEYAFPIENKVAYVPIYSQDYVIALEDHEGNRFMKGVPYDMEKLLLPGKMSKLLEQFAPVHFGFDLFHCENSKSMTKLDSDSLSRFMRISESDRITPEYRQEIREQLMQYFFDNDMVHELDCYLENLDAENMRPLERAEAIRYLILRGIYDKAYEWVSKYGSILVDPKVLVRLCSRMISRGEMIEDPVMTELTYQVFQKGKYDEFVLRYLVKYYNGLTRNLRNIWKAADSFDIDTQPIVERMLLQMMYTGSFVGEKMEIFRSYVRNSGKEDVEEAFLSFCAFDYFVKEKLEDDFVFEELLRHYHRGNKLNVVCRLAVLKYYSEHPNKRGKSENDDLEKMIRSLLQKGYYFSFFQSYNGLVKELKQQQNKTVVEYRTNPNNKVFIHYMLEEKLDEPTEFRKEEMSDMYGGIFQKSFSVFYGETLQYYITEVNDRKEQLTQSDSISKSDLSGESTEGVFNLINDIVIAQSLQDFDTADQLLREYYLSKYRMKDLFHLI